MAKWRKVIPEGRDRLQSKVLVWVVGLALVVPLPLLVLVLVHFSSGVVALEALGISLTFGVAVWALRAATPWAAFLGGVVCFLVTVATVPGDGSPLHSGLAPLTTLFLLTFGATKAGARRKVQLGVAERKKGRNSAQILANLGSSGVTAGLLLGERLFSAFDPFFDHRVLSFLLIGLLAALCEATADTVSSEIGQAFGGRPFMLTTLRRVEAGTDGAVTVLGTLAGIAGAAIVAAVGIWAMRISVASAEIAFFGGVAGLFFDSLLGATVERKGWLGNDLVNFSSTVFAVIMAVLLAVVFLHG